MDDIIYYDFIHTVIKWEVHFKIEGSVKNSSTLKDYCAQFNIVMKAIW